MDVALNDRNSLLSVFTVASFSHYWFFEATQKLAHGRQRVLKIGILLGWGKDRRLFMCVGIWRQVLGDRYRKLLKETKENNKITLEKRLILMTKVRIKGVHKIYNSPDVSIIIRWNFPLVLVSPTISSPLSQFQFSYFLIPFPAALPERVMWKYKH